MKPHFLFKTAAFAIVFLGVFSTVSAQTTCEKTDYDCKVRLYRAQIAADPKDAEAYYNLALALQNKNQYGDSIQPLSTYLASGVTNPAYLADGYYLRAYAYDKTRNFEGAVADYTRAIGYVPTKSVYYYQRARAYNALKKFEFSIPDLNKTLTMSPNDAMTYFERGFAYMEQKNYPPAIADFTKSISLDPNESEAFYNRGTIYYRQAKYSLSIADLDKYIELNKANKENLSDGYYNRGLAYHYLGNYDKAIADFSSAIALNPSKKNSYTSRAISYRKMGKVALATADEAKADQLP